ARTWSPESLAALLDRLHELITVAGLLGQQPQESEANIASPRATASMSVRPPAGTAERSAFPHAPQRDQVIEVVEAGTATAAFALEEPAGTAAALALDEPLLRTVAAPVPPRSAGPGPFLSKHIASHIDGLPPFIDRSTIYRTARVVKSRAVGLPRVRGADYVPGKWQVGRSGRALSRSLARYVAHRGHAGLRRLWIGHGRRRDSRMGPRAHRRQTRQGRLLLRDTCDRPERDPARPRHQPRTGARLQRAAPVRRAADQNHTPRRLYVRDVPTHQPRRGQLRCGDWCTRR